MTRILKARACAGVSAGRAWGDAFPMTAMPITYIDTTRHRREPSNMRGHTFLLCLALLAGCSRKPAPVAVQTEKADAAWSAERGVDWESPNYSLPAARGFLDVRPPAPRPTPHAAMVMPKEVFRSIAVQADGRILAGGSASNGKNEDGLVMRFLPGGQVDDSFGGANGVREAFGDEEDEYFAIGLQNDGRVIAAGSSSLARRNFFILARYTQRGDLDRSFATNGKAVTEIGAMRDAARCMQIQDDGRILVAGSSSNDADGGDNDFAVVRYTAGGALDPTFAQEGKATVDFEEGDDVANCIALQKDGKAIIAGNSVKSGRSVLALVRLNADGKRDTTFGRRGKVLTELPGKNGIATGVVLQSDGKMIVVGSIYGGGRRDVILLRYNPDGSADGDFGMDGRVIAEAGESVDGNCVLLQPDGKIIVAGASSDGHRYGFCAFRFLPSGKLDVRLAEPEKLRGASARGDSFGYAATVERDGGILVAGASSDEKGRKASIVRYRGD